MRRLPALLTAVLLSLAGCSALRPPLPAAEEVPADANFVLSLSEAAASVEEDTPSYAKIFVDGQPAGETAVGPKSRERRWGLRLDSGNRLFRFEYWVLPSSGPWAALDAQWQPTERFIRVVEGERAVVSLKFYDGARRHDFQISREPLK